MNDNQIPQHKIPISSETPSNTNSDNPNKIREGIAQTDSIENYTKEPQAVSNHSHNIHPLTEVSSSRKWYKPFVSGFGFLIEIIQILIIVVVLSVIIRSYIVQPFYIIGSSMEPTLYEQNILLIDQLSYRFSDPQRGDVVVIHPPRDTRDYIKRIIGTPGDKVEIDNQGHVLINDIILEENYLSEANKKTEGTLTLTLQDNEYFLLGDNRQVSNDSRGGINDLTGEADSPWTIGKEDIIGKAIIRWWPLNDFNLIGRPEYSL